MSTATASPAAGERVELGRYRFTGGERVLFGQRVNGTVRVTGHPARGAGRAFLVERELTKLAELEAILADYLEQAARHDQVPMLLDWLSRRPG